MMVRLSFWVGFPNVCPPQRAGQRNSPKCKKTNVWILSLVRWFHQFPHINSMQKHPRCFKRCPDLFWWALGRKIRFRDPGPENTVFACPRSPGGPARWCFAIAGGSRAGPCPGNLRHRQPSSGRSSCTCTSGGTHSGLGDWKRLYIYIYIYIYIIIYMHMICICVQQIYTYIYVHIYIYIY